MGNATGSNRFNPPVGRISWRKKTKKVPNDTENLEKAPQEGEITYVEIQRASVLGKSLWFEYTDRLCAAVRESFRNVSFDSQREISSPLVKARYRTLLSGKSLHARIKFISSSEATSPVPRNLSGLFDIEPNSKQTVSMSRVIDLRNSKNSLDAHLTKTIRLSDAYRTSKFSVLEDSENLDEDGESSYPDQEGISLDTYHLVAKTKKQLIENLNHKNIQSNAEVLSPSKKSNRGINLSLSALPLSPIQVKRSMVLSPMNIMTRKGESSSELSKQPQNPASSSKKLYDKLSFDCNEDEVNENEGTFALDIILLLKQYDNQTADAVPLSLGDQDDDNDDHNMLNPLSAKHSLSNGLSVKPQRSEKFFIIQNSQSVFKFEKLLKILSETFVKRNVLLVNQEKIMSRESSVFQQKTPGIFESHILSNNYPFRKFTIYLKQSAQLDMNTMKNNQNLLQNFTVFIKREVFMGLKADFDDLTQEEIFVCDVREGQNGGFGVDFYLIKLSPHLYGFVLVVLRCHFKKKYPFTFLDIQTRTVLEILSFSEDMIDQNTVLYVQKEGVMNASLHLFSEKANLQIVKRNISLRPPSKRSFNNTDNNQISPEISGMRNSEKKLEISDLTSLKITLKERIRSAPPPEGWLYFGFSARNKYDGNNMWLTDNTNDDDKAWVDCYCSVAGYGKGSEVGDNTVVFRGSKGKSIRAINLETYHAQDSLTLKHQQTEEAPICGPGIVVLNSVTVAIGTQKYFCGQLVKSQSSRNSDGAASRSKQNTQVEEYYLVVLHCRAKLNQIKLPVGFEDKIWVINDINSVRPAGILLKQISVEEAKIFSQDILPI